MITALTSDVSSANAAMKQSTGLNKDDFLRLFITQLQNQDPLNPQDSSQFMTQMAQLTQVEQAYNTNTNLQGVLDAINSAAQSNAVSYIGKEVLAKGNDIKLSTGSQPVLGYGLEASAASVTLTIQDASGKTVRTISQGSATAGQHTLSWDGKDSSGQPLGVGRYTFSVSATDAKGAKLSSTALIKGTVDGLNMGGGSSVLSVGGVDVPLANVLTVKGVS